MNRIIQQKWYVPMDFRARAMYYTFSEDLATHCADTPDFGLNRKAVGEEPKLYTVVQSCGFLAQAEHENVTIYEHNWSGSVHLTRH